MQQECRKRVTNSIQHATKLFKGHAAVQSKPLVDSCALTIYLRTAPEGSTFPDDGDVPKLLTANPKVVHHRQCQVFCGAYCEVGAVTNSDSGAFTKKIGSFMLQPLHQSLTFRTHVVS